MSINLAKCPACEKNISHVHYEPHGPNALQGYRGSNSFTAVAYPCGHAIGSVPSSWEYRLDELYRLQKDLIKQVDYLSKEVTELRALLRSHMHGVL